MVNFKDHLQRTCAEPDPPGTFRGTIMATITHSHTGETELRQCEYVIEPTLGSKYANIAFWITKGGVTGYESFVLRDDRGLNEFSLNRIFIDERGGIWHACAGGMGWSKMTITNKALREAIGPWLFDATAPALEGANKYQDGNKG